MVLKIIWSQTAIDTYIANIQYLEKEWTTKEVRNFIEAVQKKLQALSIHPNLGKRSGKRVGLRQIVVNKRMLMYYRYKPLKKEIQLVYFFNTHQKPK